MVQPPSYHTEEAISLGRIILNAPLPARMTEKNRRIQTRKRIHNAEILNGVRDTRPQKQYLVPVQNFVPTQSIVKQSPNNPLYFEQDSSSYDNRPTVTFSSREELSFTPSPRQEPSNLRFVEVPHQEVFYEDPVEEEFHPNHRYDVKSEDISAARYSKREIEEPIRSENQVIKPLRPVYAPDFNRRQETQFVQQPEGNFYDYTGNEGIVSATQSEEKRPQMSVEVEVRARQQPLNTASANTVGKREAIHGAHDTFDHNGKEVSNSMHLFYFMTSSTMSNLFRYEDGSIYFITLVLFALPFRSIINSSMI